MDWLSQILAGIQGNIADQQHSGELNTADASDDVARIRAQQGLKDLDPRSIQVGELSKLGPSGLAGFSTDPQLRAAQMAALQGMQNEGNAQGLGLEDRIAQTQADAATSARSNGARQAILANMQARGMGGSGAELAAQLANQQNATTNMASAGQNAVLAARQRQLESMQAAGVMGGQIRGQDFGEAAKRAAAQDAINRFNTSAEHSRQFHNADANLAAAQYNRGVNMDRYGMSLDAGQALRDRHDRAVARRVAQQHLASAPFDAAYGQVGKAAGMMAGAPATGGGGGGQTATSAYGPYASGDRTPDDEYDPYGNGGAW